MVEPTSPQPPRKIAEEAGTNIASINTYFRSKDLAVEEALSLALKN